MAVAAAALGHVGCDGDDYADWPAAEEVAGIAAGVAPGDWEAVPAVLAALAGLDLRSKTTTTRGQTKMIR